VVVRIMASVPSRFGPHRVCQLLRDAAFHAAHSDEEGYALLEAANGFQWRNDPDESLAWMIGFLDGGLTAIGNRTK
jgi:hypothetical protein